jgi:gliding motility-associated-like protein
VIDDGFLLNHEDLASQWHINTNEIPNNNIDDDNNGYIDDWRGWDAADNDKDPSAFNPSNSYFTHGTHVAGIVAAATNNSLGIASIGYNCKLIPVKIGNDATSSLSGAYLGVEYAIVSGAQVMNMSWGGSGFSATYQALFNLAKSKGIVCVAAAGNSSTSMPMYPAAYNNVISVASSTSTDALSSFTNYGTTIDVTAPGSDILSTLAGGVSNYGIFSGTSMASPLVAGICGLMLSNNIGMHPDSVEACLERSCDNIDAQNPTKTGQFGAGRVNAFKALQCTQKAPISNFDVLDTFQCVNTNVRFKSNSSGIQPLTYSWSFPGGNPSSSTLANPSVTYATAGTYSATLTVTNNFGTHSVTKTNIVRIGTPTAKLSGRKYTSYNSNPIVITIDFIGNPPYSVTLTDGSNNWAQSNITSNPYFFSITPQKDTSLIQILSFSDKNCVGSFMEMDTIVKKSAVFMKDTCIFLNNSPATVKDASVVSSFPNSVAPNHPEFMGLSWTCNGTPCQGRGFMEFDLSQIPQNAVIKKVNLYLTAENNSNGYSNQPTFGNNNSCVLKRVTQNWQENTITWNNQPSTTSQNQVILAQSSNTKQNYIADITNIIKDSRANQNTSFGIMISHLNEPSFYNCMIFASSDWTDPSKRPKLEICYSIPIEINSSKSYNCLRVKSHQLITEGTGGFSSILPSTGFFGMGCENIGDWNNDGINDLLVGAPLINNNNGKLFLLNLNTNGTVKAQSTIDNTNSPFNGINNHIDAQLGGSIIVVGDIDKDGIRDIIATGPRNTPIQKGSAFVMFMNGNGTVKSIVKWEDGINGIPSGTLESIGRFGWKVSSIGDWDNDGTPDVIIGAGNSNEGGSNKGAIYICLINTNGSVKQIIKNSSLNNSILNSTINNEDRFGSPVYLGDINKDGLKDFAVGTCYRNYNGVQTGGVFIVSMNSSGSIVQILSNIGPNSGGFNEILNSNDLFGYNVSGIGDYDKDGIDDIIVGAIYDDDGGLDKGAAWILFLNSNGTVKRSFKISQTKGNFKGGLSSNSNFGFGLTNIGDLDNNGYEDFAVGSYNQTVNGISKGAVWILFMEDTCSVDVTNCDTSNLNVGKVLHLDFNGNTQDKSGNNNHATNYGATPVAGKNGLPNTAYHFDGVNDYMKVLNSSLLNPNNPTTITVLIKPRGFNTQTCHGNNIISTGYDGNSFGIRYSDRMSNPNNCSSSPIFDKFNFYGMNSGLGIPQTNQYTPYVDTTSWFCLVFVKDIDSTRMYVNSKLVGVNVVSSTPVNVLDWYIGRYYHSNPSIIPFWLNADIDDIRIYNRTLSASEIKGYCGTCNSSPPITIKCDTGKKHIFNKCFNDSIQFNIGKGKNHQWSPAIDLSNGSIQNPKCFAKSSRQYLVVYTDSLNCQIIDTFQINIFPSNKISLKDSMICIGDSVFYSLENNGNSYSWQPNQYISSNNQQSIWIKPLMDITYFVSYKDQNGCNLKDTFDIKTKTCCELKAIFEVSDSIICKSGLVTISNKSKNIATATYNWTYTNISPNQFTGYSPPSIPLNQQGVYSIKLKTSNGICEDSMTRNIYVIDIKANAGKDSTFCTGTIANLKIGDSNSIADYKYSWTPNTGLDNPNIAFPTVNISQNIQYELSVYDPYTGCVAIDTIFLGINNNLDTFKYIDTLCDGDTKVFFGQNITISGIYQHYVKDKLNCDKEVHILSIFFRKPNFSNSIQKACNFYSDKYGVKHTDSFEYKDSTFINGCLANIHTTKIKILKTRYEEIDMTGCYKMNWKGKTYLDTIKKIDSFVFKDNGCDTLIQYVNLNVVKKSDIKIISTHANPLNFGEEIILQAFGSNNYKWNTGDIGFQLSHTTIKDYQFYVVGYYNVLCPDTAYYNIILSTQSAIELPDIFSPNDDGKNDLFKPNYKGNVQLLDLIIFNRWGEKIFEGHGNEAYWNGKYKDEYQSPGAYIFLLRYILNGKEASKKGSFVLVR